MQHSMYVRLSNGALAKVVLARSFHLSQAGFGVHFFYMHLLWNCRIFQQDAQSLIAHFKRSKPE